MDDKKIVEAALFTAGNPLNIKEISETTGIPQKKVKDRLKQLKQEYTDRDTSIEIKEVNKKYVMQVKPKYSEKVMNLAPIEISTPVLRTLSVIAFQQPVSQSEVVDIRGNKAYNHIKELNEMGFVEAKPYGRTKLLKTTTGFAEYFGIEATSPEEVREALSEKFDPVTLEDFLE
ncbi:SMC-Scp complex subunit ScpB [Methanonatronarchaeum sp. AMET6-2]|uniref:SMC-Scp complex subunit ScpB n=1 Tax=Methanonatronarchaeum sp. AMET6-2 TaxID=2933293 RepID=UPI00121F0D10|nr:SMC-Scp complex subunit ScpB [Methanonatronarchaeum sp. AMET6-2]RZN60183.1 MAG: SMC-Scp complex subunit ScpB [Methanonatronarchaeia archaeon]UOY09469.1 SMC-Scp complex subunit ScpB [Methanonatronarchaeum sp. AMET6-2]